MATTYRQAARNDRLNCRSNAYPGPIEVAVSSVVVVVAVVAVVVTVSSVVVAVVVTVTSMVTVVASKPNGTSDACR